MKKILFALIAIVGFGFTTQAEAKVCLKVKPKISCKTETKKSCTKFRPGAKCKKHTRVCTKYSLKCTKKKKILGKKYCIKASKSCTRHLRICTKYAADMCAKRGTIKVIKPLTCKLKWKKFCF
ncbi:MAG TPA: hypothetical protein DCE42_09725 [Myxococcales bacterium]|nr:hypothetical protein [Deltaproteobacteria bacterium]HAA55026.1 hypothetical protein [Myxococcales bacterium]|tara:strand:- start:4336 stop:4704 length:369 start_codon:yes stop_codon:yes gene_type:complete